MKEKMHFPVPYSNQLNFTLKNPRYTRPNQSMVIGKNENLSTSNQKLCYNYRYCYPTSPYANSSTSCPERLLYAKSQQNLNYDRYSNVSTYTRPQYNQCNTYTSPHYSGGSPSMFQSNQGTFNFPYPTMKEILEISEENLSTISTGNHSTGQLSEVHSSWSDRSYHDNHSYPVRECDYSNVKEPYFHENVSIATESNFYNLQAKTTSEIISLANNQQSNVIPSSVAYNICTEIAPENEFVTDKVPVTVTSKICHKTTSSYGNSTSESDHLNTTSVEFNDTLSYISKSKLDNTTQLNTSTKISNETGPEYKNFKSSDTDTLILNDNFDSLKEKDSKIKNEKETKSREQTSNICLSSLSNPPIKVIDTSFLKSTFLLNNIDQAILFSKVDYTFDSLNNRNTFADEEIIEIEVDSHSTKRLQVFENLTKSELHSDRTKYFKTIKENRDLVSNAVNSSKEIDKAESEHLSIFEEISKQHRWYSII